MVVALLLKAFVLDVYEVNESSMFPTLEGGKDHLLVDKLWTLVRRAPPERFAVCVFRHRPGGTTSEPEQFFVKRVLGLPNEQIDFRGGDVFVGADPGRLERLARPAALIESQRVPVLPAGSLPSFEAKDGTVTVSDIGRLVFTPDPGKTLVAAFRAGSGAAPFCIRDDRIMADRVARGPHAVSDVRVTIGAITGDAKSLEIVHLLGQGEERRVIVTPAGIEITAKTGGVQSIRASFPGRKCDAGLRLETIDGLFRVSLPEGKEWRELFSEPRETDKVEGFSGVTIEVQGGAARIDRLEVDRDVHYAWTDESTSNSLPIPSDCVFLVGDNPEISTDSRNNRFGPVPLRALVGLARAVVWPFGRAGIVR